MTPESVALQSRARAELAKSVMDVEIVALMLVRWHYEGVLAERARLKKRMEELLSLVQVKPQPQPKAGGQ